MPLRNIKLTLSYDGTDFHGWQVQPRLQTIQGALTDAIERVTGERICPHGSGRTDAGVHALAQVASFTTSSSIPSSNLRKALNSLLPDSIRILAVEDAAADFHARRSAEAKTYQYRMYTGEICPPFLVKYFYHHPYPLQIEAMQEAASKVIGEHDFTSFAAIDPEKRTGKDEPASNVRTIFSSHFDRQGDELIYTVRGSGFLHHMVRNMVGTFLLVGKGNIPPVEIVEILEKRTRSAAGPTAPPQGLFLVSVEY
jgi:tRNA pseudouridine38-40 synthase